LHTPLADAEVAAVVDRGLGPQRAAELEALLDAGVLVVDVQAGRHLAGDHPGAEPARGALGHPAGEHQAHVVRAAEFRAAVHLALDRLDAVHGAFDRAGAVGQGQAIEDGGVVAFAAIGEGAQLGQVPGVDGADPCVEPFAVQAGEHVGEGGDVLGGGVQVRAAGQRGGKRGLLILVEGVGTAKDPPGDVAGLGGRWRRRRRASVAAEVPQVEADGAAAAAVAAGLDLGEQRSGIGGALGEPLAQA
jgi:hypothetical protein